MKGFSAPQPSRTAARRRELRPQVDALETRLALSSGASLHAASAHRVAELGTISGSVVDGSTGVALRHVRLQLLNGNGAVVQSTVTDAAGQYQFHVRQNGPYVVHEVTPRRYYQTTPTFPNVEPTGSFAPGFGNSSWTYAGDNTNPASGPVDPYAWDTIAPAGKLPFESPINITARPIDLSRVLTVNYNNSVPKQIINNGHQFQVQYPKGNTTDTISVGGVTSNLAQFHYHSPSETRVRGHAYALEEHFVNMSAAGGETVVTAFFRVGAHNNALDPILNTAFANLTATNSKATGAFQVDFAGLLPTDTRGWFYEGSLTTPPLSQPVNWFVYSTPVTLDAQQLAKYKLVASQAGFNPNARPVQPLDGRRLNEVDYDVNFQNTSVAGMNFDLTPRFPA